MRVSPLSILLGISPSAALPVTLGDVFRRDVVSLPCNAIARIVKDSGYQSPIRAIVKPELAVSCLKAFLLDRGQAVRHLQAIRELIQFQSTLTWLKRKEFGDVGRESVDILGQLDIIQGLVESNRVDGLYEFQQLLVNMSMSARDAHFSLDGALTKSTIRFARNDDAALVSVSQDGRQSPAVFLASEVFETGFATREIIKIDDVDARKFLELEADLLPFPDRHTRFNAMMTLHGTDKNSMFLNPRYSPGKSTKITFRDGGEKEFENHAEVLDKSLWSPITARSSSWIRGATSVVSHQRRAGSVPASKVKITFITVGKERVALIRLASFLYSDAIVSNIYSWLQDLRREPATKLIVDLRGNIGGDNRLAFFLYGAIFPASPAPFGGRRFRSHPAMSLLSDYSTWQFSNPFRYVDAFTKVFYTSAAGFDGPYVFQGDTYSSVFTFGHIEVPSVSVYRFQPQDIVLLSDGFCVSTCALLVEIISENIGVKHISVGGTPDLGPSTIVGASKGVAVGPAREIYQYLRQARAFTALHGIPNTVFSRDWPDDIMYASVNLADSMRKNDDSFLPTSYYKDLSNCRLWYTPDMLKWEQSLYDRVYAAAWGGYSKDRIAQELCVAGSYAPAA